MPEHMLNKKGQKLTMFLESKVRDYSGVWELTVWIKNKVYTYPVSSEFSVREIERAIHKHRYGSALKLLKKFKIDGFNSFEGGNNGRDDIKTDAGRSCSV